MIILEIEPIGASWQVIRDGRLVCLFSSLPIALAAAEGFVAELIRHGKRTRVVMAKAAITAT